MPTLEFKGKQLVYAHHLTVPSRTIEVETEKSLSPKGEKPSLDNNLIIHGDNLHALKELSATLNLQSDQLSYRVKQLFPS